MTIAFYAPLKQPFHDTPSGDRAMARALIKALEALGTEVTLASTLRSRDGAGDPERQTALFSAAQSELARLYRLGNAGDWQAWVTYHNYYKAPDLLGPAVSTALGIPYLQVESTRAHKRLTGPWARFAQAAEVASDAADVIFYLTERDAMALERDAPQKQKLHHLAPFLPISVLPAQSNLTGPMLCVGMMRPGDKVSSYRLIAETLALLPNTNWRLNIAGDGPARSEVQQLLTPYKEHVHFLGALPQAELGKVYQNASLLFWPGVNEAFGLSYLEAQSHGLPVVAQNRPGVCDVLAPALYPTPQQGAAALAQHLAHLLNNPAARQARGANARQYVAQHHLLSSAAKTLQQGLAGVGIPI